MTETKQQLEETSNASNEDDEEDEVDDEPSSLSWVSMLALFGDSGWSLIASSLVLVLALGTSWYLNLSQPISFSFTTTTTSVDPYKLLGPVPSVDPPYIYDLSTIAATATPTTLLVSSKIQAAFENDGVVAIRGLLTPSQIEKLDVASRQVIDQELNTLPMDQRKLRPSTQFFTVRDRLALINPPMTNDAENRSGFLDVALFSKIPMVAAELLRMNKGEKENLRMIRDIFMAKDEDQYICGWHVDDTGFWPATATSPGINAWIAIDDMPTSRGGGFALAVGSHQARWKQEAYNMTGSTHTLPPQGYRSAADMFANRTGQGTCNIETSAPHLHRRMEETKRIYDVRRGDVLFTTRWLFHRTVPFDKEEAAKYRSEHGVDALIYRRYSVRYAPGSAIIAPGFGLEPSVLWNPENGGKTADTVCQNDGPWYPKCWPSVSAEEIKQLRDLALNKLPIAGERKAARIKEMQPFLKAFGKKQSRNRRP